MEKIEILLIIILIISLLSLWFSWESYSKDMPKRPRFNCRSMEGYMKDTQTLGNYCPSGTYFCSITQTCVSDSDPTACTDCDPLQCPDSMPGCCG